MSGAEGREQAPALRIAPRTTVDWPPMLDLWTAAWSATYPDIDFNARLGWLKDHINEIEEKGGVTLCLFDSAPPALSGFAVIDPATGWLDQICVAPRLFGTGAALALLNAARAISPERVGLDVNADNGRAIRFYEREGFARLREGAKSLSGRPTVVMEWRPRA